LPTKIADIQLHASGHLRPSDPPGRSAPAAAVLGHATNFMNADRVWEFIDANVLVYAFDSSAGAKQERAAELLARLWDSGTGCLSIQVLQEFFVTVTRKVPHPLSIDEAADRIREFALWKMFSPAADDVLAAIVLHKQAKLSFWDAMVVQAAAQTECDTLWTEDLSDGQLVRGVRIRNPFSAQSQD
jgi:predicted nucleic acid-binding protein